MIPYLIPILLAIWGIIHYDVRERTINDKWLYWGIYVYIVLLYGLRYRMGFDTHIYMDYFYQFPTLENIEEINEPQFDAFAVGFKVLWAVIRSFSDEYWAYELITSIFINLILMRFIWNNTDKKFTVLLLYLICLSWYYNMEITREAYSICFFLLGYKYLMARKWLKYYMFVAAAILFHISACILILLPLVVKYPIKFNKTFLIIVVLLSLLFFSLQAYIPQMIQILGDNILASKLLHYSTQMGVGSINSNWLISRMAIFCIFPLIYLTLYKYYFKTTVPFETFIVVMILISLGIPIFQEIFVRLTNYFRILFIISVGTVVGKGISWQSTKKFVSYSLLVITCTLYIQSRIALELKGAMGTYYPYQSIIQWKLNPFEDPGRIY